MEVWQNAIDVRREELRGDADDGEMDTERQQAPLYSRGDDKMEEEDPRDTTTTSTTSQSRSLMGGKREREDVYAIKVLCPHRYVVFFFSKPLSLSHRTHIDTITDWLDVSSERVELL
jgi:hypothetical protein